MNNRGFTLVEMIVSLALFSVVAVIAIGALLKVIDANNKAQSIQSAVTNINFALESMSRDLRTGTGIQCLSSVPTSSTLPNGTSACTIGSSNNIIAFYSTRINTTDSPACGHGLITVYAFAGSPVSLQKAEQTSCLQTGYSFSDLISSTDIAITGYELGVLYNSPSSYPLAFIRITGNAGNRAKDQTFVDLETAVSSRSQQ
jgi:prepilin-type N-terminal cleavage/methylation domain-containing protein